MRVRSHITKFGSASTLLIAGLTPPMLVIPVAPAKAETEWRCVTMSAGPGSSTILTNHCSHPIVGKLCYAHDRDYDCGTRAADFGTIAPGGSAPVPGPTSQNVPWVINYCNSLDVPGQCTVQLPWAHLTLGDGAYLAGNAPARPPSRLARGPGAAASRTGAPPSAPGATPTSAANGDVFGSCVQREGPQRSGYQDLYFLRNVCRTRISLSYCLEATFEAAGDYNLCSRREYKTHSVAPGAAVHFAFNLMPAGTRLTDGRVVSENTLYVRGHACGDNSNPDVYFDNRQFRFMHC